MFIETLNNYTTGLHIPQQVCVYAYNLFRLRISGFNFTLIVAPCIRVLNLQSCTDLLYLSLTELGIYLYVRNVKYADDVIININGLVINFKTRYSDLTTIGFTSIRTSMSRVFATYLRYIARRIL